MPLENASLYEIIMFFVILFVIVVAILGFLMPIFVYQINNKATDILSTLKNIENLLKIRENNEEITSDTDIKIS